MPLFAPYEPHVRGRRDLGVTVRVATRADAEAAVAGSSASHRRHGFVEVGRAAEFAGITFAGGEGVPMCAARPEEGA